MTFWELFQYPFMQRALIAAAFTGLAAPAVGTYLVQRRLALMGDGIGHVAVTGVALGLLTGLGGETAATLQEYLFGSLLTMSISDVVVTMALSTVVILVGLGLAPQLFAVAQDQEFSRVAGLPVGFYNVLVAVLAAITVSVSRAR